jgi:hypothetical protein
MVRKKYTEEQIITVFRGGGRRQGRRFLSEVRDERRHLLQMEGQIHWSHGE